MGYDLTCGAARLLLALRDNPNRLPGELREAACINSRQTYINARNELEIGGYITVTPAAAGKHKAIALTSIGMSEAIAERLTDKEKINIILSGVYDTHSDNTDITKIILESLLERNQSNVISLLSSLEGVGEGFNTGVQTISATEVSSTLDTPLSNTLDRCNLHIAKELDTPTNGLYSGLDTPVLMGYTNSVKLDTPQKYYKSDLLERCRLVDALDDSGDITRASSPFGVRRKQQIPLLKEAWVLWFPDGGELVDSMCKTLLSSIGNSVTDAYEKLEEISSYLKRSGRKIDGIKSYVSKAFSSTPSHRVVEATTGVKQNSAVIVPTQQDAPSISGKMGVLDTYLTKEYNTGNEEELPPPSEELLRQADEAKEYIEQMKKEWGWQE